MRPFNTTMIMEIVTRRYCYDTGVYSMQDKAGCLIVLELEEERKQSWIHEACNGVCWIGSKISKLDESQQQYLSGLLIRYRLFLKCDQDFTTPHKQVSHMLPY